MTQGLNLASSFLTSACEAELVGGNTVDFLEPLGEIGVTGIGESGGDLSDSHVGVFEQEFGVLHFHLVSILQRSDSQFFTENIADIVREIGRASCRERV